MSKHSKTMWFGFAMMLIAVIGGVVILNRNPDAVLVGSVDTFMARTTDGSSTLRPETAWIRGPYRRIAICDRTATERSRQVGAMLKTKIAQLQGVEEVQVYEQAFGVSGQLPDMYLTFSLEEETEDTNPLEAKLTYIVRVEAGVVPTDPRTSWIGNDPMGIWQTKKRFDAVSKVKGIVSDVPNRTANAAAEAIAVWLRDHVDPEGISLPADASLPDSLIGEETPIPEFPFLKKLNARQISGGGGRLRTQHAVWMIEDVEDMYSTFKTIGDEISGTDNWEANHGRLVRMTPEDIERHRRYHWLYMRDHEMLSVQQARYSESPLSPWADHKDSRGSIIVTYRRWLDAEQFAAGIDDLLERGATLNQVLHFESYLQTRHVEKVLSMFDATENPTVDQWRSRFYLVKKYLGEDRKRAALIDWSIAMLRSGEVELSSDPTTARRFAKEYGLSEEENPWTPQNMEKYGAIQIRDGKASSEITLGQTVLFFEMIDGTPSFARYKLKTSQSKGWLEMECGIFRERSSSRLTRDFKISEDGIGIVQSGQNKSLFYPAVQIVKTESGFRIDIDTTEYLQARREAGLD